MLHLVLSDISSVSEAESASVRLKIKKHFTDNCSLKRRESVAAKALLCSMLEKEYGLTDFTVDADENGKPYILGGKISFNISHSGDYVLCTVGDENVGCDIQKLTPCNFKVAKRFFADNEVMLLEKSENRDFVFTRLWALKESVLKFSGEGVSGGLDRYDFSEYYNCDSFYYKGLNFNCFEIPGYAIGICSESGKIYQSDADLNDIINTDF